ncbi:MAG: S24 family peptidase [Chloroflexota bacterium]|nr:MAG: S24 family peptidase [Chloroflexota bacterium]
MKSVGISVAIGSHEIAGGDEIIVDLEGSPKPNDVVVVLMGGDEVEVKRLVRKTNGSWILCCENPRYPESEVEGTRVLGVVIRVSRDV